MNALAHQGDVGFAGFDDCGYRVMSSDDQRKKRKSRGLCQTCGEVRTHKPGLLKSMLMPETIAGLVYKGICLKCNNLDAAKMQLCEPLDGPDNNDRLHNVYGSNSNGNIKPQAPGRHHTMNMNMNPHMNMLSRDTELDSDSDSDEPEHEHNMKRGNGMKYTTKKNVTLKAIYQRTAHVRRKTTESLDRKKESLEMSMNSLRTKHRTNNDDDDGELSNPGDDDDDGHVRHAVSNAIEESDEDDDEDDGISNSSDDDDDDDDGHGHAVSNNNAQSIEKSRDFVDHKLYSWMTHVIEEDNHSSGNSSNSSRINNSYNNSNNKNNSNNTNSSNNCWSKNEIEKENVNDFRCADSNGDTGFFTGTVISQYTGTSNASGDHHHELPHGRGEMVYDEGRIAKGLWANGLLNIQVTSDQGERYVPYLLAGYSIGDMGCKEDMVKTSRGETVRAVSKLHVNDCAFIRRSDGSWSYAIVKSRTDGETPSITFQVNAQGSTKKILLTQWGAHVRSPTKPDILTQYTIGDPGNEKDMIIEASKTDNMKALSKLRLGDAAFVKRSDMSWAYAILVDRSSSGEMKFEVNARGSTKVIALLQCGKFVRRVKKDDDGGGDALTEEEVNAIFKSMKTVVMNTNE